MEPNRIRAPHTRRLAISRRSLIAGAAASLALAACNDTPTGIQTAAASDLTASLSEYGKAGGDAPVWQVNYDIDEDEDPPETYSAVAQAARDQALSAKREEQDWTASDPLLVLDPYGTTRTGLYTYFADEAAGTLEFTIAAPATAVYRRTAANHATDGTGFAGLIVGLIPGARNELTLTWRPDGGTPVTRTVDIQPPGTTGNYQTQLSV